MSSGERHDPTPADASGDRPGQEERRQGGDRRRNRGGGERRTVQERAGGDPVIRLVDVHKGFNGKKVIDGLSLEIRRGETFVILGPSGTGKSVTLKMIVGLLQPDRGEIWFEDRRVDGARPSDVYAVRNKVGYLFQTSALINWLSVGENVALPIREHEKTALDEIDRRVDDYLKMVHMLPAKKHMPAELSGGQKRRVALARALAAQPSVLLYDEPTAGLDPVMTSNIVDLIRSVQRDFGVTSILVTHDLAAAFEAGDRVAMIEKGKVVFQAETEEFQRTDHPVVRNFLSGGRGAGNGNRR